MINTHEQEKKQFKRLFQQKGVDQFDLRFKVLEAFLKLEHHVTVEEILSQLKKDNVKVGVQYMPLHLTKYYKTKYSMKVFDYSVALGAFQRVMSLPIYSSMSDEEVEKVCDVVIKVANAHI